LTDQVQLGDLRGYLLDLYLIKADMTSMAHSLELRPALLDPELAELSFRIPFDYKIRKFQTKWILRRLLKKRLPKAVLEMPKKGFTPPVSFWLQKDAFQDLIRASVRSALFRNMGLIRTDAADRLLQEHRSGKVDHTRRLWAILALASFAEGLV
jgi:asparagine synthase (glutamine-hydrolysing)